MVQNAWPFPDSAHWLCLNIHWVSERIWETLPTEAVTSYHHAALPLSLYSLHFPLPFILTDWKLRVGIRVELGSYRPSERLFNNKAMNPNTVRFSPTRFHLKRVFALWLPWNSPQVWLNACISHPLSCGSHTRSVRLRVHLFRAEVAMVCVHTQTSPTPHLFPEMPYATLVCICLH